MSRVRAQVSKRNKYYISKHRYYELKHFCLQYPEWKRAYHALDGYGTGGLHHICKSDSVMDELLARREGYYEAMRLIEQTAYAADPDLASYILRGVTEGVGYDCLHCLYDMPCSKDMYYDRYRRFFWLLSDSRKLHSV